MPTSPDWDLVRRAEGPRAPLADRVLPVAEGVVEIVAAEAFAGRGLRFAE